MKGTQKIREAHLRPSSFRARLSLFTVGLHFLRSTLIFYVGVRELLTFFVNIGSKALSLFLRHLGLPPLSFCADSFAPPTFPQNSTLLPLEHLADLNDCAEKAGLQTPHSSRYAPHSKSAALLNKIRYKKGQPFSCRL